MTARKPHRRASGGTVIRRTPAPENTAREAAAGGSPAAAPPVQPPAHPQPEPPVLPVKAADDDPRVWGDGPEDRDSWLLEQRPPHWD